MARQPPADRHRRTHDPRRPLRLHRELQQHAALCHERARSPTGRPLRRQRREARRASLARRASRTARTATLHPAHQRPASPRGTLRLRRRPRPAPEPRRQARVRRGETKTSRPARSLPTSDARPTHHRRHGDLREDPEVRRRSQSRRLRRHRGKQGQSHQEGPEDQMKRILTLFLALLLAPLAALHAADTPVPKPNIIFLLADDLGWGDLGCYGHPHIRTPNLDALAADGRLYTSFYANGPVCSPSRAAFMTGQFPSRLRVFGALGEDGSEKGNAKYVDPAVPNMARILKQQGYATGHFGKWHLDAITDPEAPPISQYGFDESRAHVATGPSFDELEKQLPRGVGKN
ncbi:MAG: hypothetical protein FJ279_32660, partial [Planctomycetes bacterium]|nr:hypothetical protein [Planctomycetota bacterium]